MRPPSSGCWLMGRIQAVPLCRGWRGRILCWECCCPSARLVLLCPDSLREVPLSAWQWQDVVLTHHLPSWCIKEFIYFFIFTNSILRVTPLKISLSVAYPWKGEFLNSFLFFSCHGSRCLRATGRPRYCGFCLQSLTDTAIVQ